MSCPGDTKWLVAVIDKALSKDGMNLGRIINLKDPSTQESRQYIFANDKDIIEVQNLPADFSSFLVGRHVIKDGNLYVFNRVDPLFWVLNLFTTLGAESQSNQWQPFDQIVESLPQEVQKSLVQEQISHLCQVLSTDETGDVPYYKFNHERALAWLKKKQGSVYRCLLRQCQAKQIQEKDKLSLQGKDGGSISASFNMPDDPMAAAPDKATDDSNFNSQELKIESIDVISSYISEEWEKKLVASLGVNEATRNSAQSNKKKMKPKHSYDPTSHIVQESAKEQEEKKAKKLNEARTLGNKRLAKVNTKGMKSLSSFFGAPKKKAKMQ